MTMGRVLLVAGTRGLFGFDWWGHTDWWKPGTAFVKALEAHGYERASPGDSYSWTGDLDGLVAGHREWQEAGNALRWWWKAYGADAVIAHSHGLQVLAYAQIPAPALVTVGSPVRYDMLQAYVGLWAAVGRWTHLYSDTDRWQRLGCLGDGGGGYNTRYMPGAKNVLAHGRSHSGLLDPALWTKLLAWDWLTPTKGTA